MSKYSFDNEMRLIIKSNHPVLYAKMISETDCRIPKEICTNCMISYLTEKGFCAYFIDEYVKNSFNRSTTTIEIQTTRGVQIARKTFRNENNAKRYLIETLCKEISAR